MESFRPQVIHLTCLSDSEEDVSFLLWLEASSVFCQSEIKARELIGSLGLSWSIGVKKCSTNIMVPGKKSVPLPSHPALEKARGAGRPGLVNVTIEGVRLSTERALGLIKALKANSMTLARNYLIFGSDLLYWQRVIFWSTGFLIRQDLVPELHPGREGCSSRFIPLFRSDVSRAFSCLVRSMPQCCLIGCGAEIGWGRRASALLLYDVILSVVNAMAKKALGSHRLSEALFVKKTDSVHDAWLYSLISGRALQDEEEGLDPIYKRSVEELSLSARVKSALKKEGINTLHELLRLSEVDLLSIPGFGGKSLLEVLSLLDSQGLKLKRGFGHTNRIPIDLEALSKELSAWQAPLIDQELTTHRLCLRLEEPKIDEMPQSQVLTNGDDDQDDLYWTISFHLQDMVDPSLLIPASEIWMGRALDALKGLSRPRERLMSALGRAARLFPPLKRGLESSYPTHARLTTLEAYQFLKQGAWLLEEDGFGVLLPVWWVKGMKKEGIRAKAIVKSSPSPPDSISLEAPLEFHWEVAIGDEVLSHEELRRLARLKAPLVRIRGRWVELSPEQIQAALSLWDKMEQETLTLKEVLTVGLGGKLEKKGVLFTELVARGWVEGLLKGLKERRDGVKATQPRGLKARLRPYQKRGLSWLYFLSSWGLGACLADDMGLGKTVQALALVQKRLEEGKKGPVLLVCPTSVLGNWSREAKRFTPGLRFYLHHGQKRLRGKAFSEKARASYMVLTSYALVYRDLEDLRKVSWQGIILDEAQNIKNYRTLQARALRSLESRIRIAMTGTPVENSVQDLWSIMEFLNPGLLGTHNSFKRDFLVPIQVHKDQETANRLKKITGPFVLRRLKTDKSIISDLPEKIETDVFVPLTKEQASLYQAVVDEAHIALDSARDEGIKRKGVILATLTKLKQICDHPSLFLADGSPLSGRSGKLTRLEEILEVILSEGDAALVFTQFAKMGQLLTTHLAALFGRQVLFIHGGVTRSNRDKIIKRFQDDKGPPIMVLSLRAAGTGLNLTRASHVIHFDRWWNPAVEDQATDRTFRIGQKKNVQVHKFVCQGTVEERINHLIQEKKDLADRIIGSDEAWITELSTSEIKELLRLDEDQIE